jgi:polyisoprenoid-binding protein YceI
MATSTDPSDRCDRDASEHRRRPRAGAMLAGLLLSLACAGAPARADTYRLEPIHCQVLFFADHLGFSRQMGRFTGVSGRFHFDPAEPAAASVEAEIDVSSLWLGDRAWERKVLSADFFDARRWPVMRYRSTAVTPLGDGRLRVDGELTLRGVTRPVALDVRVNRVGRNSFTLQHRAGFSATATLRRSEFGMRRLLAAVGDEVEIRLEIEGVRIRRDGAAEPTAPSAAEEVAEPPGVEGPVELGAVAAPEHGHAPAVGLGERPEPADPDALVAGHAGRAQQLLRLVAEFAAVAAVEDERHRKDPSERGR